LIKKIFFVITVSAISLLAKANNDANSYAIIQPVALNNTESLNNQLSNVLRKRIIEDKSIDGAALSIHINVKDGMLKSSFIELDTLNDSALESNLQNIVKKYDFNADIKKTFEATIKFDLRKPKPNVVLKSNDLANQVFLAYKKRADEDSNIRSGLIAVQVSVVGGTLNAVSIDSDGVNDSKLDSQILSIFRAYDYSSFPERTFNTVIRMHLDNPKLSITSPNKDISKS
jgi:hypothetical protein